MKRNINIVIVLFITVAFSNCVSTFNVTKDSDGWSKHELRPSQIKTDGSVFFGASLVDKTRFGVYYDKTIAGDGDFYYNRLMQDLGWHKNTEGGWSGEYATRIEYGYIYVNPKKRVGVYFNPKFNKYTAYKVKLKE
jgi:hypothetical protein